MMDFSLSKSKKEENKKKITKYGSTLQALMLMRAGNISHAHNQQCVLFYDHRLIEGHMKRDPTL